MAEGLEQGLSGRVVTVFAAKGGVGKTTLAVNLAVALAKLQKEPVTLLDFDLELGVAAFFLGWEGKTSVIDVVRSPEPPSVSMEWAMGESYGVRILAAPPTPDVAPEVEGDGKIDPDRNYVEEIIRAAQRQSRWVVIDVGANFREAAMTALDLGRPVLLLTTGEVPTLRNTGRVLDILTTQLRYDENNLRVILSHCLQADRQKPQAVAAALDFPVWREIPYDGAAAVEAANTGVPVIVQRPRSPLARAVWDIARMLEAEAREAEKERGRAEAEAATGTKERGQ